MLGRSPRWAAPVAKRAWQGGLHAMCDSGDSSLRLDGLVYALCRCDRSPRRQRERRTAELEFVQIILRRRPDGRKW